MVANRVAPDDFVWGATVGPASVVDDVRRACLLGDGHDPLDEAAALRLKHHGLTETELWTTERGFALRHPSPAGAAVDLAVDPDARRLGRGGELAEAALSGTEPVTAWSHGDHPAAARLAARHGLERARELWVMRRSAAVPLPDLDAPEGVELRAYRDIDSAELLRVNAAAFASHPEQGAMDAADLAERMAEPWFEPAGLLVADTGSGLLGFHWTKRENADLGEVYVIGIDPAAQGRGLGRALTLAGLHHLVDQGVDEIQLYVEAEHPVGIAMYTGLGFTHAASDTHVQYRRD